MATDARSMRDWRASLAPPARVSSRPHSRATIERDDMSNNRAPARAGDLIDDIDTPALLVDLDRFEGNLARLMAAVQLLHVRVRAHAKSHKCVAIARRQIAAGVAGLCVQKTSEAEVFVAAGIDDVLVTNEVVAPAKLRRLAQLARAYPRARVGVCVDDFAVVPTLAQACRAEEARLDVYVELDVGQNRCGVATADEAVALARAIAADSRLRFMGLHAYHGSAQHRRATAERRAAIDGAARVARQAHSAVLAAGVSCERITGGGSGTFLYEAASGVYNEVQPGSFVLMDADYARNEQDAAAPHFAHTLFVLASVIS